VRDAAARERHEGFGASWPAIALGHLAILEWMGVVLCVRHSKKMG
jgi:hypothetical protein